jgi:dihydroneopterin aldolase
LIVTISLSGLRLQMLVGLTQGERGQSQEVVLNLAIDVDVGDLPDTVAATVDYKALARTLHERLEREPAVLLESVACRSLTTVMSDSRIRAATAEVFKTRQFRLFDRASVTVRAERTPGGDAWRFV